MTISSLVSRSPSAFHASLLGSVFFPTVSNMTGMALRHFSCEFLLNLHAFSRDPWFLKGQENDIQLEQQSAPLDKIVVGNECRSIYKHVH